MKFNKCEVLNLGKVSRGVAQGGIYPGAAPAALDIQLDSKLSVSDQGAAMAKKTKGMLSCIKCLTSRDREVIATLSTCQATPGTLHSVLVPTIQKRCGQDGVGPEKCHREDQKSGKLAIKGKAERTGLIEPWEKKISRDVISMSHYLKVSYKDGDSLFTWKT